MSRKPFSFLAAAALVSVIVAGALGDDFSGTYRNPQLAVDIHAAGSGYAGTIILGSQKFPLKASVADGLMRGSFSSQGADFPFTATLHANRLTLQTGGRTYFLDEQMPVLAAAREGPAPSGYLLLTSVGDGRAVFAQKPDAKTTQAALQAAVTDLNHFFDAKVTVSRAFSDKDGTHGGGAAFTGQLDGTAMKGSILCGIDDKGAAITILYDRADAPPDECAKLLASLPSRTPMQEHKFPDGTGSVEFPEDWKTASQSVVGGVRIEGPADQVVTLGQGLEVVTPDSQMAAIHNQMAAQARQMGGPQPPPILIAPFGTPEEALQSLLPQISRISQQYGGPGLTLDKMLDAADAPPSLPNSKAKVLYYAWTKTQQGTSNPYRSLSRVECYPLTAQGWGAFVSSLTAPDAIFDRDLPLMWKIAQSFKVNDQVVAQVTSDTIQRNNQNVAAFEQSIKEKNDAFDRFEQSVRNNELVESRSNADADEVIRGYRTVYDTSTGDKTSVDLGAVDGVVNALNASDPGRYVQIPLRDEEYPLPNAPNK